jgi:hypothetical protein
MQNWPRVNASTETRAGTIRRAGKILRAATGHAATTRHAAKILRAAKIHRAKKRIPKSRTARRKATIGTDPRGFQLKSSD